MEIIAQNNHTVNLSINVFGDEAETDQRKKWREKKIAARQIADKLTRLKKYKRAERMSMCGNYIVAEECRQCGNMHVKYAKLCRDRMCPVCQWRLSMRRFAEMYTLVVSLRQAYPTNRWQFVTLTCRNCEPKDLKTTIDEMMRAWNSIASSKAFKRVYEGWARSLEITYNKETKTVHPHIHILLMCAADQHNKDNGYIVHRWLKTCRLHTNWAAQDYKEVKMALEETPEDQINTSAILETYKYTLKSADMQDMPLIIFDLVDNAIQHRRLVAFGGKIKEYAKLMDIKTLDDANEEDEEEAAAKISKCTRCGSRDVAEIVGEWAGGSYMWRRTT